VRDLRINPFLEESRAVSEPCANAADASQWAGATESNEAIHIKATLTIPASPSLKPWTSLNTRGI